MNFWNFILGLPIKEEGEEDPNNSRTIEPTTFVNVSLACDEAGPSGLQQQKIADMPEMVMSQAADVDPKTGWVFCFCFIAEGPKMSFVVANKNNNTHCVLFISVIIHWF